MALFKTDNISCLYFSVKRLTMNRYDMLDGNAMEKKRQRKGVRKNQVMEGVHELLCQIEWSGRPLG